MTGLPCTACYGGGWQRVGPGSRVEPCFCEAGDRVRARLQAKGAR
jgi:hypothetical protein